jgi:hypothetical protein
MAETVTLYRVGCPDYSSDEPRLLEIQATETAKQYRFKACRATAGAAQVNKHEAHFDGFFTTPNAAVSDWLEQKKKLRDKRAEELARAERLLEKARVLAQSMGLAAEEPTVESAPRDALLALCEAYQPSTRPVEHAGLWADALAALQDVEDRAD